MKLSPESLPPPPLVSQSSNIKTTNKVSVIIDEVDNAVAIEINKIFFPKNQYFLHDAAEFGHARTVDTLIRQGANMEVAMVPHLFTPFVRCASMNPSRKSNAQKSECLARDKYGKAALYYVTEQRVGYDVDEKANLDLTGSEGNTAITIRLRSWSGYLLLLLMEEAVDLKHKNKEGRYPLFMAGEAREKDREF